MHLLAHATPLRSDDEYDAWLISRIGPDVYEHGRRFSTTRGAALRRRGVWR